MLLIIQIALGFVLAIYLLANLPQILAASFLFIVGAIGLIVIAAASLLIFEAGGVVVALCCGGMLIYFIKTEYGARGTQQSRIEAGIEQREALGYEVKEEKFDLFILNHFTPADDLKLQIKQREALGYDMSNERERLSLFEGLNSENPIERVSANIKARELLGADATEQKKKLAEMLC